eukprot:jgi/Mesen1/5135/ME000255S04102
MVQQHVMRLATRNQRQLVIMSLCISIWLFPVSAYNHGDFVPMARKGQFHGMRTHWHDVLGRHCPRYGINREAVIPVPRPVGFTKDDSYKLSLSFGRERYTTPWLFVVSSKKLEVPLIDVALLRGVRAKVIPMSPDYMERHKEMVEQFYNATHWPKNVLVRYTWVEHTEVDVTTGLFVLFGSAVALTTTIAIYILQSSKDKLAKFVNEQVVVSGPAGEVAKIE